MKKGSAKKGFTLIEVLVSIGILTILMGTSLAVLVESRQFSEDSRSRVLAMDAARSVLEVVKETPLSLVPSITVANYVPAGLKTGSIAITTSSATGDLTVDSIATVTVTVTWNGTKNRTRTLQLTTMRSKY